ncbi:hypothetical protein HYX08_00840 [Candidatus Woesearchaeota archaeon]|nr:hypothetical protein [Candidatus Woesearchaeota archaeon]
MAKDPICGMDVNESAARKKGLFLKNDNAEYFFCSPGCKEKFEKKLKEGKFSAVQKSIPIILVAMISIFAVLSFIYGFMPKFMGIFFLIVSLLKMPDWKGFVNSFSMYDVIAKNFRLYAWAYPAIEFILGILFFFNINVFLAAAATLIIMSIGTVGVTQNLLSKNPVKCACLGTLINIPLTKFTLFEDILMAVMALMVLIF